MADGEVALEGRQLALVEGVGDEAHLLDDHDRLAVAHRHARRLLASVLEGVEAGVGQMGDRLARRVHPKDAARLARAIVSDITATQGAVPRAVGVHASMIADTQTPYARSVSFHPRPVRRPVQRAAMATTCT